MLYLQVMKLSNKALEADMKLLRQRMEQLEMATKQRYAYRFWTWRANEDPNLGNIKGKTSS